MSTCISRHGEFSAHTLDDSHTCTLCHVLDEEALRAELERLRERLRSAAEGAPAGPELPWRLRHAEGWARAYVNFKPALGTPLHASVAIRGMCEEFTADELEQGIAAMSEAVRRIREHESRKDVAEALPSDPELIDCPFPPEFLNARVQFWMCPDGHSDRSPSDPLRQTVEWRADVAHCLEPGCGKTSAKEVDHDA